MKRREFFAGAILTLVGRTTALPATVPAGKLSQAEEHEAWLAQIEEDNLEVWRQTFKAFLEAGGPAIRWCCLDPVQPGGYRVATIHLRDDETKLFRWKQPWVTTSLPHRRWLTFDWGERILPTKIK